ncbi:hypothetical protein LZP69_05915 [Shewanella sp. AS1]|uniref:hypothetical protein n=1 Tax=Shewanella sp. AS1 TaxID=2907626 RepID=UPI001F292A3E|nr:hypothetical protein [Shewanella sp. AS1]MCE9678730.1 hypothetical protein [Shewanella sp. AS1]
MKISQLKRIVITLGLMIASFQFVSLAMPAPVSASMGLEMALASDLEQSQSSNQTSLTLSDIKDLDRRKPKTKKSPAYLDSVGKITVYLTNNNEVLHCSGTLISAMPGQASRVVKSAGHCFGSTVTGKRYQIRKIKWEVTTKPGVRILKHLTLEYLVLEEDLALLSFKEKIPFRIVKPAILVNLNRPGSGRDQVIYMINANSNNTVIAAGFSTYIDRMDDKHILAYDNRITSSSFTDETINGHDFSIRTVSFSGSSGGACLLRGDLSEAGIDNPRSQLVYLGTLLSIRPDHGLYKNRFLGIIGSPLTFFKSFNVIDFERVNTLNRE